MSILIVPGLHSSGPDHWQTWFEQQLLGTVRVNQSNWAEPHLAAWSARVQGEIVRYPGRHIIVAHSFGVLASVHAASLVADRISGALLVAPADPEKFAIADEVPRDPLPFPSVVVASTNDPWMSLRSAVYWAGRWGADLVNLGAAGHINAQSGFGSWPEGLALLDRVRRRSSDRKTTHGGKSGHTSETTDLFKSWAPSRPTQRQTNQANLEGLKL